MSTDKPDQSFIQNHESGATSIVGKDAINLYRAATLKAALSLYAKSGIRMTRTATPMAMLAMAKEYTGKTYKRGEHAKAAEDMDVWIGHMNSAIPRLDAEGKQV